MRVEHRRQEQIRADYNRWHAGLATGELPTATAPWHELAKPQLGRIEGLHVLEIGCGRGAFAEELVERGADVVAADFSTVAVEQTRDRLTSSDHFEARVADIQQLPFADESFDLTVSLETIEHVADPERALSELVRVTRRGGRLIVTAPNYLNLVGLYRVFLRLTGRRYTEGGQPVNQPLLLPWRVRALKRRGCRVEAVEGRTHPIPLPGGTREIPLLEKIPGSKWVAHDTLTAAARL